MLENVRLHRRAMMLGGMTAVGSAFLSWAPEAVAQPVARKGRIRQSIAFWCFNGSAEQWSLERTCAVAKMLGCKSVELVMGRDHEIVRKHGLTCALAQINLDPDPPFVRGFNNPSHWPAVIEATRKAIDEAAHYGAPNVIAFTGYSAKDPNKPNGPEWSPEEGAANCVEGLKQVMGYAEKKKVTLCLEVLNTRDDSHPMKGHPGYQGNHTEYCVDIVKRVGSPRMKLLFDVYHVQVMDGDIIRRVHQHRDFIGHVHVAGNPGRGELDAHQEISFPAVMEALLDVGYEGYVGHEYLPTQDVLSGLRQATSLCDV